jgi:uncharacterized protein (DUF2141 family)
MRKTILYRIVVIFFVFLFFHCANRGTASGGEKDITSPVIISEMPENFSTNFSGNEIKIYFDEYIKLKNIQKQLIVSPPMDPPAEITPMGSASKHITIKIHDNLQPNTTYAFNFGSSIEDNNEGNVFPFYRYVFSTGATIDSLSVSGSVSDALERETPDFVSVLLHELDSTYTDSIIFKQKPKYIGVSDSLSQFSIENLKAGEYLLTALKEENTNYTYQPKKDKFAYRRAFITVPSDTAYVLKLFEQALDFKFVRAREMAQGRIGFGYEGNPSQMRIKRISPLADSIAFTTSKEPEKDTLNYWMRPKKLDVDSLLFEVAYYAQTDTVSVRIKSSEKDSLSFKAVSSTLKLNTYFKLNSSIPIANFDSSKTTIMDKDSLFLDSELAMDSLKNTQANLKFNLSEGNRYKITFLPGAFTDFYGAKNDTLNFTASTKLISSYGNLRLVLKNATYPVVVQIVSTTGAVEAEQFIEASHPIDFIHLKPGKYFLRAVFDTNKNGRYDAGNFLLKTQPERVSYAKEVLEVRAGWDAIEEFVFEN